MIPLALVVGVIVFVYQANIQTPLIDAGMMGLNVTMLIYLTWALFRDLNPDNSQQAIIGMGVIVGSLFGGSLLNIDLDLLALFWLLFVVRANTGIAGRPLSWIDIIFLTVAGGWVMYTHHFSLGILLVFAFRFEFESGNKKSLMQVLTYAALAGVLALAVWQTIDLFQNQETTQASGQSLKVLLFAAFVPFMVNSILTILRPEWLPRKFTMSAIDDTHQQPLSYDRYAYTQLAVAIVVVLLLVFEDISIFYDVWTPLIYAIMFIGIFAMFSDLTLYATPSEKKKMGMIWGSVFLFGIAAFIYTLFGMFP